MRSLVVLLYPNLPEPATWSEFTKNPQTEVLVLHQEPVGLIPPMTGIRHAALDNPSLGVGGMLKISYQYALNNQFDIVIPIFSENPADQTAIPVLIKTLEENPSASSVIGTPQTSFLQGICFPLLLLIRSVNFFQNVFSKTTALNWQSPYKAFRARALTNLGFELNTHQTHFDTEVLLQMVNRGFEIKSCSLPAPGPQWISWRPVYLINCLKASLKFFLRKYHLLYDIRFDLNMRLDPAAKESEPVYQPKLDLMSPHSLVCSDRSPVSTNSRVLDIGCAAGYVGSLLATSRNCVVEGIDMIPPSQVKAPQMTYHQINLETELDKFNAVVDQGSFDSVLLLDILEHLSSPENFLINMYRRRFKPSTKFIISTGNVAFFVVRFLLLMGQFNYGKKGILDVTHKRLFSPRSFRNLLEQTGFIADRYYYLPFPFRELGFPRSLANGLEFVNRILIKLSSSLFAYQIMVVASHLPSSNVKMIENEKGPAN